MTKNKPSKIPYHVAGSKEAGVTLKVEWTYSSEISVDFQRTTGLYIAEDVNLQFIYRLM
jgi:hypothetical protein